MHTSRRRRDSFDSRLLPWDVGHIEATPARRALSQPPGAPRGRPRLTAMSSSPPRLAPSLDWLSHNLGAHSNCAGSCGVVHTLAALSSCGALYTPLVRGRPRSTQNGVYAPGMALLRRMQAQIAAQDAEEQGAKAAAAGEESAWLNVVLARRAARRDSAEARARGASRVRGGEARACAAVEAGARLHRGGRSRVRSSAAGRRPPAPPPHRATLFPYANSTDAAPPHLALQASARAREALATAAACAATQVTQVSLPSSGAAALAWALRVRRGSL